MRVLASALEGFCRRVMIAAGAKPVHADTMARVLTAADVRGVYSHGCNRLEMYASEAKSGLTDNASEPSVVKESAATAMVAGNNCHGPVVGEFAMKIAIAKAKDSGVGWVTANGSNHYGIAGHYAMMASREGLVGLSMTNTSPLQVPTRARKCTFGTNPIAFAAPGSASGDDAHSFVLDMATSTCPIGKVELASRKELPIPNAWGVDPEGRETNDPNAVLSGGGLLPLGGSELTAGYKGYGLAFMVELLCGIMGNAEYGPHVRPWRGGTTKVANLGQCFIAVNPDMFAEGFAERAATLFGEVRSLEPAVGETEVLVPGDPELRKTEEQYANGVELHENVVMALNKLAGELKVELLEIL